MHIDEMFESKFLKRGDVTPPKVFTIAGFTKTNLARQDQEPQYKWTCKFVESDKPLVCNKTNLKRMSKIFASEDTSNWIGKRVEVYFDEDVEMGGDIVGGIRVRKPTANRKDPVGWTGVKRPLIDPNKVNAEIDGAVEDMPDDLPWEDK